MLDRERRRTKVAAAKGGRKGARNAGGDSVDRRIDEEHAETRANRVTIVPQPLDELDSDVTVQRPPLTSGELGDLQLDDPDIFDPDADEPTLIGYNSKANQSASNAAIARPQADSILNSAHPIGVAKPVPRSVAPPPASVQPPASVPRPASVPPPASVHPPASAQRPTTPRHDSQISQAARVDGIDRTKSDRWYLRVQLNTECVADLWVREMTPHNVLVWSEEMQTWVPLLTVRELRDAIRDAHDSKTRDQLRDENFVFLNEDAPLGHEQPLPQPRVPASMGGVAAVPRPTANWSLPKPRTISNVPPPMLTASVPIVASAQHPLILPQPRAQRPPSLFTVPPVVSSVGAVPETITDVEVIPDFPRPARVPSPESVSPVAGSYAGRLVALKDRLYAPSPASSSIRPPPPSSVRRARGLLGSLPLMHVERAVWLAAGVAVASAVALLMRDGESAAVEGGDQAKSLVQASNANAQAVAAVQSPAASPSREDVHRLEDLPVVGAAPREHAATGNVPEALPYAGVSKGGGKARPPVKTATRGRVEPANIHLAASPAAGVPDKGGFDTGSARRILGSAAGRASRCAAEGPASGSVVVTFAPTGFVQSATMSGLKGKVTNVACVLRAFQESRVAPFSGAPVTVRKGFQIQ